MIKPDGSGRRTLAHNAMGGFGWTLTWSPDGKRIAYQSLDGREADLHVMNADGTKQQRLTRTPNIDELEPIWQPSPR